MQVNLSPLCNDVNSSRPGPACRVRFAPIVEAIDAQTASRAATPNHRSLSISPLRTAMRESTSAPKELRRGALEALVARAPVWPAGSEARSSFGAPQTVLLFCDPAQPRFFSPMDLFENASDAIESISGRTPRSAYVQSLSLFLWLEKHPGEVQKLGPLRRWFSSSTELFCMASFVGSYVASARQTAEDTGPTTQDQVAMLLTAAAFDRGIVVRRDPEIAQSLVSTTGATTRSFLLTQIAAHGGNSGRWEIVRFCAEQGADLFCAPQYRTSLQDALPCVFQLALEQRQLHTMEDAVLQQINTLDDVMRLTQLASNPLLRANDKLAACVDERLRTLFSDDDFSEFVHDAMFH